MQVTVTHIAGSKAGQTQTFDVPLIQVGRDPANQMAFDPQVDLDVSSRHAQLVAQGEVLMVQDLGSRNGTFLNGAKVGNAPIPVPQNATIAFGENGPKITVTYGAGGPGKKTRMISDLQGEVEAAKKQAASEQSKRSSGRMVSCCIVITIVLIAGAVLGWLAWSKKQGEARLIQDRIASAKTKTQSTLEDVQKRSLTDYAKDDWARVQAAKSAAEASEASGDLAKAAKDWEEYDLALTKFVTKASDERGEVERKKLVEELAERQKKELEAIKEEMRKRDEEAQKEKERLEKEKADAAKKQADELAKADSKKTLEIASKAKDSKNDAEVAQAKAALEELLKKDPQNAELRAQLEALTKRLEELTSAPKRLEKVVQDAAKSVVMIETQTFAIPGGQTEETTAIRASISEGVGSGFYVAKDRILTAKEVIEPWQFDAKAKALVTKLRERNWNVITKIQVSELVKKGEKLIFEVTHPAEKKEAVVLTKGPEVFGEEQKVQIPFEGQQVEVPVRVHKRDDSDYAVLELKGKNATPLALAAEGARKAGDRVVMLGEYRVGGGEAGLFQQQGDLKEAGDRPLVAGPSYSGWVGGPVLDVDGKVVAWIVEAGKESRAAAATKARTN